MTPLDLIEWTIAIVACVAFGMFALVLVILIASETVAEIRSWRRPR